MLHAGVKRILPLGWRVACDVLSDVFDEQARSLSRSSAIESAIADHTDVGHSR